MATVETMPSTPAPKEQSVGLSPVTLVIASASSVAAALVVSRVWGPGTLVGAAVTPLIITLVSEALRRPAEKITVIRVSPAGTEIRERDVPPPAPGEMAPRSVHRTRRRPVAIALATGLVAFVIGAVLLTGGELLFGSSAAGGGGGRTTVFGGPAETQSETAPRTGTTTTTPTGETTTETPAPEPTTVTTTQTAPAAPPPAGGPTGATGATGVAP